MERLLAALQQDARLFPDSISARMPPGVRTAPPLKLRLGNLLRLPEDYGERHVIVTRPLANRGPQEWVEFKEVPGPGPHSVDDRDRREYLDIVFVAPYERNTEIDPLQQTSEIRDAGVEALRAPTAVARFPQTLDFLFAPHRYKVAYGGRGGAKSWGFARALLILGAQKPLHILCARETQKSIDASVHRLLRDQIKALGLEAYYEVQRNAILGSNGTDFIFAGLKHNITSIKSVEACDIVWVEEGQSVSDESWSVLIPTIRKEGSEIWVSFNPKFETDAAYERFIVTPPRSAKVIEINWRDNPWFPETLQVEREDLLATDPDECEHVYEGKCITVVKGAIFGAEMKKVQEEGRICSVPYDRTKPVDTFWDLGYGDDTAIWFAQAYGGCYNLIDYHEDSGQTIEEYLIRLQRRGYVYGTDYLPWDAVDAIVHKKLAGDRSRSIEMLLRASGRKVRVVPKLPVIDGINAARTILPLCRFDAKKCADGLRSLRLYQWGPATALGVHRRTPLHDGASHAADAFRALALTLKQPEKEPDERPTPSPRRVWGPGDYAPFG